MWKDKRATAADRCARVAELVRAEPDATWVVWCDTDDESDMLQRLLPEAVEVRGSQSVTEKERRLRAFSDGTARIIITKPDIAGLGLNWQHASRVVFTGLTYSFEKFYQALRRCYRFGQRQDVYVHLVVAETEGDILSTIQTKEAEHREMQRAMNAAMRATGLLHERHEDLVQYRPDVPLLLPKWLHPRGA
jgi:superfamily II DNA/RNA helicase